MGNPERYRKDLPEIPGRMLTLPVERGFPVPWFVAEVDGHYDFRILGPGKLAQAVREKRCWVCGGAMGRYLAFTIGPMCAVNRTIAEPPSHRECAEFSAVACPFLTQRETERRTIGLPEEISQAPGFGLTRQPGVVALWVTKSYRLFRVPSDAVEAGAQAGVLFHLGDPTDLAFYREGRPATRAEVEASVLSGLPSLRELAEQQGPEAVLHLGEQVGRFWTLLDAYRGWP